MSIKVAVCQVPEVRKDIDASLRWIRQFTLAAQERQVSLICFPECFLQGYLTESPAATDFAVNLNSAQFNNIMAQLAAYTPTIVVGLIEEDGGLLFNTAVVMKEGKLIGRYRKTHLLDGESIFTPGKDYPIFEIENIKFGINICYDTQFPEATDNLARQSARLILCVSNTMMRYQNAIKYKHLHVSMRAERVHEAKVWMLSSDITGERDGRIAYGSTSAINPDGKIIEQVGFMETGMIIVDID